MVLDSENNTNNHPTPSALAAVAVLPPVKLSDAPFDIEPLSDLSLTLPDAVVPVTPITCPVTLPAVKVSPTTGKDDALENDNSLTVVPSIFTEPSLIVTLPAITRLT